MKHSFFLFLLIFLFSHFAFTLDSSRSETVVQNTEDSSLILVADVEKIEKWKDREEWQIVSLKPTQILKGSSSLSSVKLLDQKLFPNSSSLFQPSKKILVFLKELPSYTAWQEMIKEGIRFELAGKSRAIFESDADQKILIPFISELLQILKLSSSEIKKEKLKVFYLLNLQQTSSKILQEDLAQDFFRLERKLNSEDLHFLSNLVSSSKFSNKAKIQIVKGFLPIKSTEVNATLKSFFCVAPEEVCLISAEALESRNLPISLSDYSKVLEKSSGSLKVGLFQILGRHQRRDAYPLFEKFLAKEKDSHNAAEILEALGEMGGKQAETLSLRYAKDPRYYVRMAVVRNLGKLKSVKGIHVLETALKSGDPAMITVAAKSLERIGTPEALQTLEKYYEKTPHGFLEPAGPQHFNLPK